MIKSAARTIQRSIVHEGNKVCAPDRVRRWLESTELLILDDLTQSFAIFVYCGVDFSDEYVVTLGGHVTTNSAPALLNIWGALLDVSDQLRVVESNEFAYRVLANATGYNFMRGFAVELESDPRLEDTCEMIHTGDWLNWKNRLGIRHCSRPEPMEELVGHIREHSMRPFASLFLSLSTRAHSLYQFPTTPPPLLLAIPSHSPSLCLISMGQNSEGVLQDGKRRRGKLQDVEEEEAGKEHQLGVLSKRAEIGLVERRRNGSTKGAALFREGHNDQAHAADVVRRHDEDMRDLDTSGDVLEGGRHGGECVLV